MLNSVFVGNEVNFAVKKVANQNKAITEPKQAPVKKELIKYTSNNDMGAFRAYILGGISSNLTSKKPEAKTQTMNKNETAPEKSQGKAKKQDPVNQWIKTLPFAEVLSPEDRRNLGNVIRKNDEETAYMKKLIHLVCKEEVNPYATASLCKNGKMSDLAKSDIDTYYSKVKEQKMSLEDAFVPMHKSDEAGKSSSKIGDVYRVKGQDKIFIKTGEKSSEQLGIDAKTYLALFPPVERYASAQGGTGDCYLLSSINSVMENDNSRVALYRSFQQTDNGVSVTFPDSDVTVEFPGNKLPKDADMTKYTTGSMGMKMLEHAYGINFEAQKYDEYKEIMKQSFEDMNYSLYELQQKAPTQKNQKKIEKLEAKIERFKANEAEVTEAMKDPKHKLTFALDDYDQIIVGNNGPIYKNCNELDAEYKFASDYYRGGVGGYPSTALGILGFQAEEYIIGEDNKEIKSKLFDKDTQKYIITASTPAGEEMESPVEKEYSVYSSHAYKVTPYDDENGNRMFKVTNPWNQSHQVIMDFEKITEFFQVLEIADAKQQTSQTENKKAA